MLLLIEVVSLFASSYHVCLMPLNIRGDSQIKIGKGLALGPFPFLYFIEQFANKISKNGFNHTGLPVLYFRQLLGFWLLLFILIKFLEAMLAALTRGES